MLKQSHINNHYDQHDHLNLYDKVRQDLFEEEQKPKQLRAPSITTIFLLQIQAYIVQILLSLPPIHNNNHRNTNGASSNAFFFVVIYQQQRLHVITSIRSVIRQCIRWVLLVVLLVLDNIARVLNVEGEMYELTNKQQQKEEKKPIFHEEEEAYVHDEEDYMRSSTDTYRDDYYLQKKSSFNHGSDQCTNTNNNKRNTSGIPSEPSSPTHPKKLNGGANSNYSPSHSPTPNFIRNPSTSRPSQQKELSPNLNPSRVNNRARSLSNNLDGYTATKQQKLRRITGQREITLQNAILPIPSRNNYTSGKPPLHNIVKKASSVVSRSSSESISGGGGGVRPKMQKTQSLSTAQQYHNSHNHNHHHHHEVLL
ncbi:unnamed protein product [Mucor hiemalis]